MSDPVPTAADPVLTPRRVDVFDGLRGIAIALVVLSHGWAIWPSDWTLGTDPVDTLFKAGNFAVSVFFVVGAFVATRGLLRRAASPAGLNPGLDVARRYVRLTGQVAFLLLVVVLVAWLDPDDPYDRETTRASVVRILTYTWNFFLRTDPAGARADLGHLWYLSVYLQALVLVTVLVWMLRRRPGWLVVTLGALILASWAWTSHVTGSESEINTLLRTSVRIDAPLAGALAAALLPFLPRMRPYGATLAAAGGLALLPLAYATTHQGYLGWWGHLTVVALMLFVLGVSLAPAPRLLAATLGAAPLALLGARSLGLYIWHYPVFFWASRQHPTWDWWWRTALAFAITVGFVLVSELLVERRVQQLLGAEWWGRWRRRREPEAPADPPRVDAGTTVSGSGDGAGRPG